MDEKRRTVALTAGAGVSLAAAAAGLMMRDPWARAAAITLARGYERDPLALLGFAPEPRIHGRVRSSGGNKKWSASAQKRKDKRKAQKQARATTRKHRKHG